MTNSDQTTQQVFDVGSDAEPDSRAENPGVEELAAMLAVEAEADNGYQLLRRPWEEFSRYWQVVDPEGTGPFRKGSPNGGVLFNKDERARAEQYFEVMADVPHRDGHTSVPGHIAGDGPEAVVKWLAVYREYTPEEIVDRTGLPLSEVKDLCGEAKRTE